MNGSLTLHFFSLHLWQAFTTLLRISPRPEYNRGDGSPVGEFDPESGRANVSGNLLADIGRNKVFGFSIYILVSYPKGWDNNMYCSTHVLWGE